MRTNLESPRNFRNEPGWKSLIILCAIVMLIRIVFTGFMGIMPQDAYYYFYAKHLDLSYYDHPPMIAYLLRLFTGILGKSVFVLKLADTTVTLLTLVAFFRLAKKFLPVSRAWLATILLISTLMISILSLVSTPDVPLLLCWTLSLHFLFEALFNRKHVYWIWAGILTGLSFDSKYTGLFLLIGLLGFLIISKSYRKILFSRWIFIYLVCFAMTILPVVVWNVRNGFASFKFQSEGRVKEGMQFDPGGFAGLIGHQSAILLPFLFFSLCYFIYRLCRKYGFRFGRIPDDLLFLLCFFIPLFLGFLSISFIYWVKLNWIMPAYLTGIIWVSRYWSKKWIRYQLIFSVVLHLLMAVEIIFYIIPIRSDDTWFGWSSFSGQVKSLRSQYPDAFIFSSDDYKTSAILNFYLDENVYSKNVVGQRALQFDFVGTDLHILNGRDALFIDSNPRFTDLKNEDDAIPGFYHSFFDQIIPLSPILVEKNGRIERKFSVFLCKNYHAK